MNEIGVMPATGTGPSILANWTRLSPETAQTLYNGLVEGHPRLISSKTALARLGDLAHIADLRLRLIMALCRAAMEADMLGSYCRAIVGEERANGRSEDEMREILERIGAPGTAHAMVDRARGLIPTTLFGVLDRLAHAIGYVEGSKGPIGTAILVRRDVIITCAHVAFEAVLKGNRIATEPPVRDIRRIIFPVTLSGPQEAQLAPDPVLSHSEALMIEPGKLDRQVTEAALGRLDFALLRLDRAIDRVEPVDLSGADVEPDKHLSFLIGFPEQQTAAMFDADRIVRSEAVGGRLIHMINSLHGMSGGCVIGDNGIPIGIHEGSIPKLKDGIAEPLLNGKPQVENRAVMLKAISTHLKAQSPNPLAALDRPTGLVMYEEALVTRLGRRGPQLLADPAMQAEWQRLMTDVTRAGPDGPWKAHPWFTDRARARIEKWFADASSGAETASRIAFINGPRGSGKTFMIDILKRIVLDAGKDVVRVAWSEGDTTLAALARQITAATLLSGTRTSDGHERYETVPQIVEALASYGTPDLTPRKRPLFIVIDAGDGTGSVTEPKTWIELVSALARRPWARVVLCGLPEDLRINVEDDVPLDVSCEPYQIDHIRSVDIVSFLERFGMAREAQETAEAAKAAFDAAGMPHKAQTELTTCMAALFAIGWHRGILPVHPEGQ